MQDSIVTKICSPRAPRAFQPPAPARTTYEAQVARLRELVGQVPGSYVLESFEAKITWLTVARDTADEAFAIGQRLLDEWRVYQIDVQCSEHDGIWFVQLTAKERAS